MDRLAEFSGPDSDSEVVAPVSKKSKVDKQKAHKNIEHYNVQKLIWLFAQWKSLGLQEDVSVYRKMLLNVRCSKEMWPYGSQDVSYERSGLSFGRLTPTSMAYILMNKRIRQTIADNKYVDIDFVNCH